MIAYPAKTHSFPMLDIIRGIAALMVAERHLSRYFFHWRLPGSYLAVDIFFVLSGFVLAHAYEPRLANGLSTKRFLTIRAIRLYPLYLLALLLGFVMLRLTATPALPGPYLGVAAGMGALFLPLVVLPPPGAPLVTLYPLNHPSWTLLFELIANMLHAMLMPWLTNRVLNGIILISAGLLILATLHFQDIDVGYRVETYVAGFPRVFFSYFLGVRLCRYWQSRTTHSAGSSWAIMLGLIAIMALPVPVEYRAYYDLAAVLVIIPALIYCAASVTLGSRSTWLLPLGTASYAYYVLHVPFGALCDGVAKYFEVDLTSYAPWSGAVILAALLGLTLALDRYYDLPLRKWLLRRFA